ncbi:MAG TPA: hypothetical protein VFR41_06315, partial [Acidimicrobiia bacterium]|nr:hypothetical protein [Acidimicrobiia bacterium]
PSGPARSAESGKHLTEPLEPDSGGPRWRLASMTGPRRRILLGVAVVVFVIAATIAIKNFPHNATKHAHWWLFAVVGLAGPILTILLNGAEYVSQARIVDVHVPFGEGIRISVLGTAANLLPVPGSALVRTHALATSGQGYKRATKTTVIVGGAWIGTTAVLAAILGLTTGAKAAAAPVAVIGIALLIAAWVFIKRAQPASGPGDVFRRLVLVEAGTACVGAARFFGVLYALGISVSAGQAMALALTSVIASAAGVFPAGIGIREALAGAVSAVVGLPAAAGVVAAAADRVAGLIVLAVITAILVARNQSLSTPVGR